MNIEHIAVHEAGHAVAYIKLRIPMKSVSIVPDKETNGRVIPGKRGELRGFSLPFGKMTQSGEWVDLTKAERDEICNKRCQRDAQQIIKVCLAGPAAQHLFFPDSDYHGGAQGDYDGALRQFKGWNFDGDPDDLLTKYFYRAQKLVCNNALEIAVVAQELLEHQELSAKQVRTLVKEIHPIFSPWPKLYEDLVKQCATAPQI